MKENITSPMANPTDTLVIDSAGRKKDRVYFLSLLVFSVGWTTATVCVTSVALREKSLFLYVWLLFGFAGVVVIPLSLMRYRRKEVIRATRDGIVVEYSGIVRMKVAVARGDLEAVTLERYFVGPGSFGEAECEAVWTLNLIRKTGWRWKRIMLAAFASPEDKNEIYVELVAFLRQHGFSFREANGYSEEKKRTSMR